MNKNTLTSYTFALTTTLIATQAQAIMHKNLVQDIIDEPMRFSHTFHNPQPSPFTLDEAKRQEKLVNEWNRQVQKLQKEFISIPELLDIAQILSGLLPQFDNIHKSQALEIYTDFLSYFAKTGESYLNDIISYIQDNKHDFTQNDIDESGVFLNLNRLKNFLPNDIFTHHQKRLHQLYQSLPK